MQIWVDADACPKTVKEILFRAAQRTETFLHLVANQVLMPVKSRFIKRHQVASGFDMADLYIIEQVKAGDLVITADIPLAASVIEKGAFALNPRGHFYSKNNVRVALSVRNFNQELRGAGVMTSGPNPLTATEVQTFAKHLDTFLTQQQLKQM